MTTRKHRIQAALAGDRADRLPVAMWRHWPGDDQDGAQLAETLAAFHRRYDWDFAKINPSGSYAPAGWGGRTRYLGQPLGEADYLDVGEGWGGQAQTTAPLLGERSYLERVVKRREDWAALRPLDPTAGMLGEMVRAIRLLRADLGPDVPILMTVFNPLNQARHLVGQERLPEHFRLYPDEVRAALETICRTTERFVEAVLAAGADGIFVSSHFSSFVLMSEAEYRELGMPYDVRVFEAASAGWCNVFHFHGPYPMLRLAREYPIHAANWDDRTTDPSLGEGKRLTGKAVFGGINHWGTLMTGTPDEVAAEGREAMAACAGRGMLLSGGCTYPLGVPTGNLVTVRRLVEEVAS